MQCNGNFKQWFNVFLVISEAWQGYESKAYGVSNHHLKLQSKRFSRTRDIPNFPTQGWGDTAFTTNNSNGTFSFSNYHLLLVNYKIWTGIFVLLTLSIGSNNEISGGSKIFQIGASTPEFGAKIYYLARFSSKNCMKMKLDRERALVPRAPCDLPMEMPH